MKPVSIPMKTDMELPIRPTRVGLTAIPEKKPTPDIEFKKPTTIPKKESSSTIPATVPVKKPASIP